MVAGSKEAILRRTSKDHSCHTCTDKPYCVFGSTMIYLGYVMKLKHTGEGSENVSGGS